MLPDSYIGFVLSHLLIAGNSFYSIIVPLWTHPYFATPATPATPDTPAILRPFPSKMLNCQLAAYQQLKYP